MKSTIKLTKNLLIVMAVGVVIVAVVLFASGALNAGNSTPKPHIADIYTLSANDNNPVYGQTDITLTISPTPEVTWYIYNEGSLMFTVNPGVSSQHVGLIYTTAQLQFLAIVGSVQSNVVTLNVLGNATQTP